MLETEDRKRSEPRVCALIGAPGAGKTSLLNSILYHTGAVQALPEAAPVSSRAVAPAETRYLGDVWTFIDTPGSGELVAETAAALMVADVAVIVCDADPERAASIVPLLKLLEARQIPHILFVNKIDALAGPTGGAGDMRLSALIEALQAVSVRPLVLRQMPSRDESGRITGYVDLVSERAYSYRPGEPSDLVSVTRGQDPAADKARQAMLETVADHDEGLFEQLVYDIRPDRRAIYDSLARDMADGRILPVFLGSATSGHGIGRLLKALRHETPGPADTAARLRLPADKPLAQVFKAHAGSDGRQLLARVWGGILGNNALMGSNRISGMAGFPGGQPTPRNAANAGEIVLIGKLDEVEIGDLLFARARHQRPPEWTEAPAPVMTRSIELPDPADDTRIEAACAALVRDDPSLRLLRPDPAGPWELSGQGDIHLAMAVEALERRFGLTVRLGIPPLLLKETIDLRQVHHLVFSRPLGDRMQFADVTLSVSPAARGSGADIRIAMRETELPKPLAAALQAGICEGLKAGPFGFPVTDIVVEIKAAAHHPVDSTEAAFAQAGRQAVLEALAKSEPVLLEPVSTMSFWCASADAGKVQRMLSQRRGQVTGFGPRNGWDGWDVIEAHLPEVSTHDLIAELRSISHGLAGFSGRATHYNAVPTRLVERVLADARKNGSS